MKACRSSRSRRRRRRRRTVLPEKWCTPDQLFGLAAADEGKKLVCTFCLQEALP